VITSAKINGCEMFRTPHYLCKGGFEMGMKAEFNWYIVLKEKNIVGMGEDVDNLNEGFISTQHQYHFVKEDFRIYPMETPLPLIYNGRCLALAMIKELLWKNGKTILTVEPVLILKEGDPVREYYEDSFRQYKKEQQMLDDGGKIDVRNLVNLRTRVRI
jgi:hypothetical protein